MNKRQTRSAKVQKGAVPQRLPKQHLVRQPEQGPVQTVAPQVAYQRAQVNRNGLTPADLLALQRTVGNQWVQRQFTREPRSLNQSLDPSALTESEIYQEIQLIRQWLGANSGSSSEKDRLMAIMQSLENKVWQGEKKRKAAQAPQPKESKQITVLDYDIFSLPNGQLKSGEAGLTLIRNWEQVEQVYLDAASGNPRAQRFVKDVEEVLSFAGKGAAEKAYSLECTLPIMKEFSKCIPNWSFFDFLRKDKPGALRLRQVIAGAYEKRSQELGIRNEIIGHAVNLLLAGIAAKGALTAAAGAEIKEGLTLGEASGVAGEGKAAATETAGAQKALAGEAKIKPPTEASIPQAGVTAPNKYSNLTNQQLRKLLVTDPEAAEALRLRYRTMSDRQLADLARRGDAMAKSVQAQRFPANKELQKILGSDYRPPHEATAVARDRQGKILWSRKLSSGNMTPAEESLGYPKNALATHTEARAVTLAPLVPGGTLSISGQYDPCGSCQRAMAAAATKSGATIIYWWPGGRVVFKP